MRRPERRDRQRTTLRRIREIVPDVSIRTTVIVGFPGETEDDVRALLDFLEEARFDRVGVFTYSAQEGTRAFDLPDDVPDEIKRERLERVTEVQRLVTADRYGERVGQVVRALVDRPGEGDGPAQARTNRTRSSASVADPIRKVPGGRPRTWYAPATPTMSACAAAIARIRSPVPPTISGGPSPPNPCRWTGRRIGMPKASRIAAWGS